MTNKNEFSQWLDSFVDEKKLPNKYYEIDYANAIHHITTEQVLDIIRTAPAKLQNMFKNLVVKIDFNNGDINKFFEDFAKFCVENIY